MASMAAGLAPRIGPAKDKNSRPYRAERPPTLLWQSMVTLSPAPAALPPSQRIYAVGDVHGCADRLIAMHRAIAADLAERPVAEALLIHIGDYIDRGPDSAEVIATLLRGPAIGGVGVLNLMGNH